MNTSSLLDMIANRKVIGTHSALVTMLVADTQITEQRKRLECATVIDLSDEIECHELTMTSADYQIDNLS